MAKRSSSQAEQNLSPIESQLLDNPKYGDKLRRGGSVQAEDLDLTTRRQLGIQSGDSISFRPSTLRELGQNLQITPESVAKVSNRITPIKSIRDVVNAKAPEIVQQSEPMGNPLLDLRNQALRNIQPSLNKLIDALSLGIVPALEPIPTENMQTGNLNLLQRILNPEGRQRTGQQFLELIRNIIPTMTQTPTIETELLKRLTQSFPDLAGRPDAKGLKRFSGTGNIKLGSSTYSIDDSGRIVKVR